MQLWVSVNRYLHCQVLPGIHHDQTKTSAFQQARDSMEHADHTTNSLEYASILKVCHSWTMKRHASLQRRLMALLPQQWM